MAEKVQIDYDHRTEYNTEDLNVIGATTNQTLRTLETISGTTYYVRKFGQEYKVLGVVNATINTPRGSIGVNEWKWEIRGADTDTLFGTITDNGSSTFTAGTNVSTEEQVILKLVWIMGTTAALVDGDDIEVVFQITPTDVTIVTDETGNHTVVVHDDAILSTDQSKYSTYSGKTDGFDDHFSVANSNDFDFGAGDFTLEFWWYAIDTNSGSLVEKRPQGVARWIDVFHDAANDKLKLFIDDNSAWGVANGVDIIDPITYGQWYHIAVTRNGNDWYAFIDGVQAWTVTDATTLSFLGNEDLEIFKGDAGNEIQAFINGFRITKGAARYTVPFTPPALPLIQVDADDKLIINFIPTETKTFLVSDETLTGAGSIELYASATESTYYDSEMKYGGYRHTEAGTQTAPDLTIATAVARCGANDGVEILDSAIYDETDTWSQADIIIQASLGQIPTFTYGRGARFSRMATAHYNNANAVFFNKSGNDGTGDGSWQKPYLNPDTAITNRGGKIVVFGGLGVSIIDYAYIITSALSVGNFKVEADHDLILRLNCSASNAFQVSAAGFNLHGILIDGVVGNTGVLEPQGIARASIIHDCTFLNLDNGYRSDITNNVSSTEIKRCIFDNCTNGINEFTVTAVVQNHTNTIIDNIFKNNTRGLYISSDGIGFSANLINTVEDNIFLDNITGMEIAENNSVSGGYIITGSFSNNTIFKNSLYGVYVHETNVNIQENWTITKNIYTENGTAYFTDDNVVTITFCNFHNNTVKFAGFGTVISNNEISGDPELSKITSPFKWGLSSESVCYKTDGSQNDIGAIAAIITIAADNVKVNGIIFDGQEYMHNALLKTGAADHEEFSMQWCTLFNFQGIAIDNYIGINVVADVTLNNSILHNNGDGIRINTGGNVLSENLFYANSKYNYHSNLASHNLDHNSIHGGTHGLYFGASTSSALITNNIIDGNSIYSIYSDISISGTYNCITGALNNFDISDESNITDSPLFVNTNAGEEDLHIKTIEGGFLLDSACKETASDGKDMGVYDVDYSTIEDTWEKYNLMFNPRNMNEVLLLKGLSRFEDALGDINNFAKSNRISLPFVWAQNSATNKEQRLKIRYFASLIPTRENELRSADCEFRIHVLPTKFYGQGTGTIDATLKTLTDLSAAYIENEKKGWFITIIFESGVGSVIDATAKTLTKTGAFTGDDYTGYFLPYNGYYYFIKSNTDNALTLSDPNGTLINSASFNFNITKQFKCNKSRETVLTMIDDDSELIAGSYSYYIDYILCKVKAGSFRYRQPVFDIEDDKSKSGYAITFEEID